MQTANDMRLGILKAKQQGDQISRDILTLMDAARICATLPDGEITVKALQASAQSLVTNLHATHAMMNTLAQTQAEIWED